MGKAGAAATTCAGGSYCSETPSFSATVTDFRTSTAGGFKVIDAVVRFQNRTNQPLILGYVDGSASATDDRGNRYALSNYGSAGLRGMGLIRGGSLDAKFVLQPGGSGDARFELLWRPGRQIYGSTFELALSVRQINSVEGNQYILGGEFPLHYLALSNGASGSAAPAAAAAPAASPAAAAPASPPPAKPAAPAARRPSGAATDIVPKKPVQQ